MTTCYSHPIHGLYCCAGSYFQFVPDNYVENELRALITNTFAVDKAIVIENDYGFGFYFSNSEKDDSIIARYLKKETAAHERNQLANTLAYKTSQLESLQAEIIELNSKLNSPL